MEMTFIPIRVESDYNFQQYKDFFVFNFFRGKHYRLNQLLDFAGMPLLYLLIKAYAYWHTGLLSFGTFDLLYIAFYLLLVLYVVLAPRMYYNQAKTTSDVSMNMEFYEDSFTIYYEGAVTSGESNFRYNALYKVYELPKAFYIYITSSQAYLLDKDKLTDYEIPSLRDLLKEKAGSDKYVICSGVDPEQKDS